MLVYHFAVLFWVRQEVAAPLAGRPPLWNGDAGAPSFARLLQAFPFHLGAFGIALFFLLSGFVIALSMDRYSRLGFLVGRGMRVLPTYAVGYLVTCLVLLLSPERPQHLTPPAVLAGLVPGLPLFFGIDAPPDGIVWTLLIELVFYAVCFVAYGAVLLRWETLALITAACVAVQTAIEPVAPAGAAAGLIYMVLLACPYLPVMLTGTVLSGHLRNRISGRRAAVLALALSAAHVYLAATSRLVVTDRHYRLTFVATIGIFGAVYAMGSRWRAGRVADFVADISYPLYVVHPVLGYALIWTMAMRGLSGPLAVALTTTVAVAAAWALHVTVEGPTHRLGQRWARALSTRGVSQRRPAAVTT